MANEGAGVDRSVLWQALVETVHALPMYKYHRRYVENVLIRERPDIQSKELSLLLNIPLGEAMVLLDEIRPQGTGKSRAPTESGKTTRSANLLDFSKGEQGSSK